MKAITTRPAIIAERPQQDKGKTLLSLNKKKQKTFSRRGSTVRLMLHIT
jgi:hypothetical protein